MKHKELLLEFTIFLINVSTFPVVRAGSLRTPLTNLSDISSNVGLLIGNTLTNDSLASVPHVIIPGHYQNTMTSSTPSSPGTTTRGPIIKTTNTERETTSAVSSSQTAQQGHNIPSNISSFNKNTSQNSNNSSNNNNYSNNSHSNSNLSNNTNQNNTSQINSNHHSNNTGNSTKGTVSPTSGDYKDSITIGNTQSSHTTLNIQTTYIKTDPAEVTTKPTTLSTSKPTTIISTTAILKTKPVTTTTSPSSTTTTTLTTKSTPTTLLTETIKTSSTTKTPSSTTKTTLTTSNKRLTKTTNQDFTTIEGNTEDTKQKENKPTPATGRTTPVSLANSTTKSPKTVLPNTDNKNDGSFGGEMALVGETRTTSVLLTQPSSTTMDSKLKSSTKSDGDFLKVTSPVLTKQSNNMPIKTSTNPLQTNPAKGDGINALETTTGKTVISAGKSTTLFISQRTTPKFLSATSASVEQSTSLETFTTEPSQSDGDKYWPVAMAITIGVPAIIVIGVTISVMNRKRNLEKAHNTLLNGYITPPMEYDV